MGAVLFLFDFSNYEATKIELLEGSLRASMKGTLPRTTNSPKELMVGYLGNSVTDDLSANAKSSISLANLLKKMLRERQPLENNDIVLRDKLISLLRSAGVRVSTDWEEGQRVLYAESELKAKLMGSRLEKRKTRIAAELQGWELTAEQRMVVDVFTGVKNNQPLEMTDKNGVRRRIIMRQGNELGGGTKHSIYGHYETTEGVITADDIVRMPDVLAKGERESFKRGKTQLYKYTLKDEKGTTYTLLTEVNNRGRESFADFYTNKKASTIARLTTDESVVRLTGETNGHTNTQLSAQADIDDASSGAKLQKVLDTN